MFLIGRIVKFSLGFFKEGFDFVFKDCFVIFF